MVVKPISEYQMGREMGLSLAKDNVTVTFMATGHFHENLENGLKFYSLNFNGILHVLIGHNLKLLERKKIQYLHNALCENATLNH